MIWLALFNAFCAGMCATVAVAEMIIGGPWRWAAFWTVFNVVGAGLSAVALS